MTPVSFLIKMIYAFMCYTYIYIKKTFTVHFHINYLIK